MATETEAKIKVDALAPIVERLRNLGALDQGTSLERNWVLDRPDGGLMAGGVLLRVRNVGDVGGILTVKRRMKGGEFKTREEVESMIDSTDDVLRQLQMVGFEIKWIYEKQRATWVWHDCVLALDECPEIGCFVEIEGEADDIRLAAADIGLDPALHIQDSYLELWMKHLAARGEDPRHMVFPAGKERPKRASRRFATRSFDKDK